MGSRREGDGARDAVVPGFGPTASHGGHGGLPRADETNTSGLDDGVDEDGVPAQRLTDSSEKIKEAKEASRASKLPPPMTQSM